MLIPTYPEHKTQFYPLGNTPAADLLRHCADTGDGKPTKLLSLGCGDARNVLFTLHQHYQKLIHDSLQAPLELTLCDIEPAVLARNVFLFTFIVKHMEDFAERSTKFMRILWNLYYHFFIHKEDLADLQDHAASLVACSQSNESWAQSAYSAHIDVLALSSLPVLRQIWSLYCTKNNFTRTGAFGRIFEKGMRSAREVQKYTMSRTGTTAARVAGMHAEVVSKAVELSYGTYWSTGMACWPKEDAVKPPTHVNPTFSFSTSPKGIGGLSGEFAVHCCTHFLDGFHLPHATNGSLSPKDQCTAYTQHAMSTFTDWCQSFAKTLKKRAVALHIHPGDALSLLYALQCAVLKSPSLRPPTHTYVTPSSVTTFQFSDKVEEAAAGGFHVIDTSNLIDHVGLLSILPACVPLLNTSLVSALYTETFFAYSMNPSEVLYNLLRADPTTVTALIGVHPSHVSQGWTAEPTGNDKFVPPGRRPQTRMNIRWRQNHALYARSAIMKLSFPFVDSSALATFLYSWYASIFEDKEDISLRQGTLVRNVTRPTPHDAVSYNRLTFVALLGLIRSRCLVSWPNSLQTLMGKILNNQSLILNTNNLPELLVHLNISNIWSHNSFAIDPRGEITEFGPPRQSRGERGLLGAASLPGLAYVALTVPRRQLTVLTEASPSKAGNTCLHLSVRGAGFENAFFALQTFFGKLQVNHNTHTADLVEDLGGWNGDSDMIACCIMPTFQFLVGRRGDTTVALVPDTQMHHGDTHWTTKLGMSRHVYAASIHDEGNLVLLRAPPRSAGVSVPHQILDTIVKDDSSPCLGDGEAVLTYHIGLSKRLERVTLTIPDETPKDGLKPGPAKFTRISPRVLKVDIDERSYEVGFPVSLGRLECTTDTTQTTTTLRVTGRPVPMLKSASFLKCPCPLLPVGTQFYSTIFGSFEVDVQPPMDFTRSSVDIKTGLTSTIGAISPAASTSPGASALGQLSKFITDLIQDFFDTCTKSRAASPMVFALYAGNDLDCFVIANTIRYDLHAGAGLVDAVLLPLSENTKDLIQGFANINGRQRTIQVEPEVLTMFKLLCPSLVERCRQGWKHGDDCEYRGDGALCPLTTATANSPVCTCGAGKDVGHLPSEFDKVRHLCHRVAISPMYPSIFDDMSKATNSGRSAIGGTTSSTVTDPMASMAARMAGLSMGGPSRPGGGKGACDHCGQQKDSLKACNKCKTAQYCDRECQKKGWKVHKKQCAQLAGA